MILQHHELRLEEVPVCPQSSMHQDLSTERRTCALYEPDSPVLAWHWASLTFDIGKDPTGVHAYSTTSRFDVSHGFEDNFRLVVFVHAIDEGLRSSLRTSWPCKLRIHTNLFVRCHKTVCLSLLAKMSSPRKHIRASFVKTVVVNLCSTAMIVSIGWSNDSVLWVKGGEYLFMVVNLRCILTSLAVLCWLLFLWMCHLPNTGQERRTDSNYTVVAISLCMFV